MAKECARTGLSSDKSTHGVSKLRERHTPTNCVGTKGDWLALGAGRGLRRTTPPKSSSYSASMTLSWPQLAALRMISLFAKTSFAL